MKIKKQLLCFGLCPILLFSGCSLPGNSKTLVKDTLTRELDSLKQPNSEEAQKYVSLTELFSGNAEDMQLSPESEEIFPLFFEDFDYKITDIQINSDTQASAQVTLTTIDAASLARDFAAAKLENNILAVAKGDSSQKSPSLEDDFLLLGELMKNTDYSSVDSTCTIELQKQNEEWELIKNQTLENQLIGGLMTSLTDSDILPPKDTVQVYLDTLSNMDDDLMASFLGIDELVASENTEENNIAKAIINQIHKVFHYEVKDEKLQSYKAEVTVDFMTFDIDAILEAYQIQMDAYLASADAVIDGSEKRQQKSRSLLIEAIQNNEAVVTSTLVIPLIDNGILWEIQMDDASLENAFFGDLAETLNPEF